MTDMGELDLSILSGYRDNLGLAVLTQMIELYIQQSAQYLSAIDLAIALEEKDWQESCHKMKGASGSVGLIKVNQKVAAMEKAQLSETEKKQALTELASLNTAGINAFQQWLK